MAKIFLNGKEVEIREGISIADFLKERSIRPEIVTVEVNEKIIDRQDYSQTTLKDGDRVEFVFFMGGGSFLFFVII